MPEIAPPIPMRWFHWTALLALLLIGASMRTYRVDRESLAFDEYWALYLSTGRGSQLFEIPHGKIIDSPPHVDFAGAPSWWHIWSGLGGVIHPPLYYAAMRWCADLFGSSDRSMRLMSVIFELGAVVVLFDVMRRVSGPRTALIAAGLMIFSPAQINHSQLVRPYAMLLFFGLVVCDAIVTIDRKGASTARLAVLAIATTATALIHYFAAGALLGSTIYIAIRLRGKTRVKAIGAVCAGLLAALIVWTPMFWNARHLISLYKDYGADANSGLTLIGAAILRIPMQLCFDSSETGHWIGAILLAAFVYISPLFRMKKSPEMLLWWLWMIGTISLVAITDMARHSNLITMLRYVFLTSPAIYAVIATSLPGRLSYVVAWVMLLSTTVYGLSRVQTGPETAEDWKTMAHLIHRAARPNDVVAIIGYYSNEPAFDYFVISHYAGDWHCPVLLLDRPPDQRLRNDLAGRQRVWMVGHAAVFETARMMSGWSVGQGWGVGRRNAVWMVVPPETASAKK